MIVFPNCKINLGLDILRKRPDGYHDLQTVFYPVPYTDMLEFVPDLQGVDLQGRDLGGREFRFDSTGLPISSDPQSNLCVKAYHLFRQRFPDLPPVHMHLHKIIPMGAGLGGGSSDGAHTLLALNKYFKKQVPEEELINMSLQLGSDCPFFIINKPVAAYGRGEIMEPLQLSLKGYTLVLIQPGIHVSTKEAFAGIIPDDSTIDIKQKIAQPIESWKQVLSNQFEATVGAAYPVILEIKQMLYDQGAVYASMTGSGSVVYGIFREKPALPAQGDWKTITVTL